MRQTAFLPMVQRAQYGFQAADWKRGFERYNDLIDALAAGDGEVTGAATSDEPQRVAGRANGARMSLSLLRIEGLKTAVEP